MTCKRGDRHTISYPVFKWTVDLFAGFVDGFYFFLSFSSSASLAFLIFDYVGIEICKICIIVSMIQYLLRRPEMHMGKGNSHQRTN